MDRISILALAIASASAQIVSNPHLIDVCQPSDAPGQWDWNAPCNALMSIQYECMYGPGGTDLINDPKAKEHAPAFQPYQTQRACICQSQHNDMLAGCMKCLQAHGGVEGENWYNQEKIEPIMTKYCDAQSPARQNYAFVFYYSIIGDETSTSDSASAQSTPFSDPGGNSTDVSLYFTPSITGTPAYIAAMPTPASSGGNVTYTSLKTSGGLIVPTASADGGENEDEQASGTGQSGSGTTSSDAGAIQTNMAYSDVMGILGFAALVAVF